MEAAEIEFHRRNDCTVYDCMPVVVERRSDGLRNLALVRLGFSISHICDGDWFAPRLPTMDARHG